MGFRLNVQKRRVVEYSTIGFNHQMEEFLDLINELGVESSPIDGGDCDESSRNYTVYRDELQDALKEFNDDWTDEEVKAIFSNTNLTKDDVSLMLEKIIEDSDPNLDEIYISWF